MTALAIDRLHALGRKLQTASASPLLRARSKALLPARLLRALYQSWQAAGVYGPAVELTYGIPRRKQAFQLYRLMTRHSFSVDDYYRFRMYCFDSATAALFLPLGEYMAVRELLYDSLGLERDLLADKRMFYRACEKAGLPVPVTIADFESGETHWWSGVSLPPCDLFSKEAAAMGGAGAVLWRYSAPTLLWTGHEGGAFDIDGLVRHLCAASQQVPLLLQRCLSNHAEVAEIAPSGVCTVRVVTIRRTREASPSVIATVLRMPTDGDVADNFARGGLACPIDRNTGMLGPAVRKSLDQAYLDVLRHPNTGAVIEGRRLPMWQQIVDLALCAHATFDCYPSVGWDIAITPEGPVLMEGNYNWGVLLAQQPGCCPIGATPYPDHFFSWFEKRQNGRN